MPYLTKYVVLSKSSETIIIAKVNKGIANIGSYTEALSRFDEILQTESTHVASLYYKGQCLDKLGYVNEAAEYKDKASEIDPTYKGGFIKIVKKSSP